MLQADKPLLAIILSPTLSITIVYAHVILFFTWFDHDGNLTHIFTLTLMGTWPTHLPWPWWEPDPHIYPDPDGKLTPIYLDPDGNLTHTFTLTMMGTWPWWEPDPHIYLDHDGNLTHIFTLTMMGTWPTHLPWPWWEPDPHIYPDLDGNLTHTFTLTLMGTWPTHSHLPWPWWEPDPHIYLDHDGNLTHRFGDASTSTPVHKPSYCERELPFVTSATLTTLGRIVRREGGREGGRREGGRERDTCVRRLYWWPYIIHLNKECDLPLLWVQYLIRG